MKYRNRLWLISAPVSLLYLGAAVLAFVQFRHLVQTLKYYGISEEEQLRLDNVVQMRNGFIIAGVVFLLFGLFSAIITYGLFRNWNWAKYSWYALSACFVVFHLYRFIEGIGGNAVVLIERGVELGITLGVAIGTVMIILLGIKRPVDLPPPPPKEFAIHGKGDT